MTQFKINPHCINHTHKLYKPILVHPKSYVDPHICITNVDRADLIHTALLVLHSGWSRSRYTQHQLHLPLDKNVESNIFGEVRIPVHQVDITLNCLIAHIHSQVSHRSNTEVLPILCQLRFRQHGPNILSRHTANSNTFENCSNTEPRLHIATSLQIQTHWNMIFTITLLPVSQPRCSNMLDNTEFKNMRQSTYTLTQSKIFGYQHKKQQAQREYKQNLSYDCEYTHEKLVTHDLILSAWTLHEYVTLQFTKRDTSANIFDQWDILSDRGTW